MSVFKLPDLGEGLSEAEIVRWHVKVGDHVQVDAPMLSVETAKAVVEVPAPASGTVVALHAQPGERIEIGAPLMEFAADAGDAHPPGLPIAATAATASPTAGRAGGGAAAATAATGAIAHAPGASAAAQGGAGGSSDEGTVVGHMRADEGADALLEAANAVTRPRVRAVPAARALARSLGVDLSGVRGSGADGLVTLSDVIGLGLPARSAGSKMHPAPAPALEGEEGDVEVLRSLRRAMAQSMALSRDSVMACSVFDDADLHRWRDANDYTTRVLRAIAAAARAEPGLNAWYDAVSQSRTLFEHVHVGIAVDTADGLLVPVVRNVDKREPAELRAELDRLKRAARDRTVKSEELRHFTFMLSNFGMMAGRYATPVVVPPAVAILGTGRARRDVIATEEGIQIHPRMPLSLTFDHRVITGGEAVRFLGALITDLELPE